MLQSTSTEISPLVVSIAGFADGEPEEDADLRKALDESLVENDKTTVHTVANTIFPRSVWRASKYDRAQLFKTYKENIPRYKALESRKNHRGLYFERLIAYGDGPHDGNQLEFIITEYNSRTGVRRSMLQASLFDPKRDHIRSAQLGFPCLQHVSFVPNDRGLIINSFYATQQIFEKAYGNYLGLCRLGHFMAHEMHLTLERMNCVIGVEKLDFRPKTKLSSLVEAARKAVA
ncbi:MAG: hypothetical protein QOG23_1944 [Blastocatellia bacterium]|nr:hypothetical protein [Blastocatellia bacterium]